MTTKKQRILIVGLNPDLLDFSADSYRFVANISAETVRSGLNAAQAELNHLGYQVEQCLIDLGETAEAVLRHCLQQYEYDCVLVGAGVRVPDENFILFEKVMNIIHQQAKHAAICFNRQPDDTAEAVRRWLSTA